MDCEPDEGLLIFRYDWNQLTSTRHHQSNAAPKKYTYCGHTAASDLFDFKFTTKKIVKDKGDRGCGNATEAHRGNTRAELLGKTQRPEPVFHNFDLCVVGHTHAATR